MNVQERLTALRQLMEQHNVAAMIVPSTDPHGSEYVAEHWQERQFVSGFTGSAGTAVITRTGGCLWTDSRYFLQAAEQLKPSGLTLQKDGEIGTPTISEWLGETLEQGAIVAVNAAMFAINDLETLRKELADKGLTLDTQHDLIAQVWHNRPALPKTRTYELPEQFTGRSTADKLHFVRAKMANAHVTATLFTALDDIAWLLNVRGADIAYNPVTIAFAAVESDPTAPIGVYGNTKREGEIEVMNRCRQAVIIRTAWLYSTFGNNFVKTMLRLGREKQQLGVISDQIGTPTYAADLAEAILHIIDKGIVAGIYHYTDEGVAGWYDFTKAIHRIAGITTCQVNAIGTEDYPTPARRPHYSVLNKKKIKDTFDLSIPHWEESLVRCIDKLTHNA